MKPYFETPGATLYCGDCLTVLPTLAAGSVDAVVTDPPYSSGGAFRADRSRPGKEKAVGSGYVNGAPPVDRPEFYGDNRDQRSYLAWCSLWLAQCLRASASGGTLSMFTDWRQLPISSDALQCGGWVWRGVGVWDKTEAARPQKGCFRNQCEYFVWGSKGPMPQEGNCLPGLWRQSVAGDEKFHVAGKPVSVMSGVVAICPPPIQCERCGGTGQQGEGLWTGNAYDSVACVCNSCSGNGKQGGLVLDPFAGSGTTGVACLQTGRRFIGVELSEQYCEIAARRLEKAAAETPLFTGTS